LACEISFKSEDEPDLEATLVALQENSGSSSVRGLDPNCDAISNVKDVNYPDGSTVKAGETFTKTWSPQNTGTCTWTNDYGVALISAQDYSIMEWYPLNQTVVPGSMANVSAPIHAPLKEGTETYYYMLVNGSGQTFGFGERSEKPFWANFKTTGDAQVAENDDEKSNNQPPPAQDNKNICNNTASLQSSPIGNLYLTTNDRMDLYWTITNTGGCTWDTNYRMILSEGNMLVTVDTLNFNRKVYPGESIEFLLPIVSGTATGNFYQKWEMVTSAGEYMYFGNSVTFSGTNVNLQVTAPEEPKPLPPEPEVAVDWNATKLSWVGLGHCPTQPFDPDFTLTLTSKVDRTITYDFTLDGSQTHPTGKYIDCQSPSNNNRYIKELKANQPTSINGKFTNCDLTGYTKGTITIKIFDKKTFSETKLLESSVQFEHTCGK
jgi:hypothetical protein